MTERSESGLMGGKKDAFILNGCFGQEFANERVPTVMMNLFQGLKTGREQVARARVCAENSK